MNITTFIIIVFFISIILNVLKNPNFKNFFKGRTDKDEDGTTPKPSSFSGKVILGIIILIVIAFSLFDSFYTVDQSEQALIFRFGAHNSTVTTPGLKFKIPFIETVEFVNTNEVKRLEYGFKDDFDPSTKIEYSPSGYSDIGSEKTMITGDENLVETEVTVQYKVIDPEAYLLNVDDPVGTLELAAYSRIRRVVANHTLDDILTLNKAAMQQEMMEDIQEIANKYGLGVLITTVQLQDVDPPDAVADAFTDVASAKEDKERYINEANQYFNKIIPEARAQKEKFLNEAEAYKMLRINSAEGDVARFVQVFEKYEENKTITKTRMYIETMQEVLPGVDIYIVDGDNITMLPVKGAEVNQSAVGAAVGAQ